MLIDYYLSEFFAMRLEVHYFECDFSDYCLHLYCCFDRCILQPSSCVLCVLINNNKDEHNSQKNHILNNALVDYDL